MQMEILPRALDFKHTQENYRKVAWFYDLWSRLTESKAAALMLQLADIHDGEDILEVACGTGVVFEQIVRQNPSGTNIGIDLSPAMLAKARKRLAKTGRHNYVLQEGNALHLDFSEASFDLVVNNFMIDLMPEDRFDQLAAEFYRVIRPGGRLAITTFGFGKNRINKIWYYTAKYFPDLLTGCRPVSFKDPLIKAGFSIEKSAQISQNTFPAEILLARK